MAKKPQDRYQTCEELRDALRTQAVTLGTTAQTHIIPSSVQPLPNPITTRSLAATKTHGTQKQRRSERGAMVFMLLLMAALAGVVGWGYQVKKKTGALPPPLQKAVAYGYKTAHTADDLPQATPAPIAHSTEPAAPGSATDLQPETGTPSATDNSAAPALKMDAAPVSVAPSNAVDQKPEEESEAASTPAITPVQVSAQQTVPTISASADPFKTQTAAQSLAQPPAQPSATTTPDLKLDGSAENAADAVDAQAAKQARRALRQQRLEEEQNLRVEGFSRADVPDLLRKAD